MVILSIASINVRGINNCEKRLKLYHYLRHKNFDVIFLQETHSCKNSEKYWRSQWAGNILFSHGSSNSRGTAILFKRKSAISVKYQVHDPCGRYVIAQVEFEMLSFLLVNLYAPNIDDESYFVDLAKIIADIPVDLKMIGGDYNLVLDVNKDKSGGIPTTHFKSQEVIKNLIQSEDLIDIWRHQHPYDHTYTWYRKNPELIQCRLDFFLVSNTFLPMCLGTDIIPGYMSDHSIVTFTIEIENSKKGPGFWRLNTSLLEDIVYIKQIRELIKEVFAQQFTDLRAKWDFLKFQIKMETIKYASFKKKCRNNLLDVLERKLQQIQERLSNKHFLGIELFEESLEIKQMENIKLEIDELLAYKIKGTMIRSRANWYQFGEKPSKYFLKLEQNNSNKKNRFRIKNDKGEIIINRHDILKEQEKFYSELYSYHDVEFIADYLKGLDSPKLNYGQKLQLDGNITLHELREAQKDMKIDKTPGADGLPIEFYRTFWDVLETVLHQLMLEIADKGLSIDQGRGIISLIEKPEKDLLYIKNWRPLSLLNVDAKIYSKILANRLYLVLPDIIHNDQVGFLPGRYLGENIMDALALIEYTKANGLEGMIISVDFEKAFDSTNWETMYSFLEFFNFGVGYINMVRMLYRDITSCTINNGYSSSWFGVFRGQRQGDCLSPPLFLVFAEILALKIRQNENIEGFTINGYNKKQSQFADDLWAGLKRTQKKYRQLF